MSDDRREGFTTFVFAHAASVSVLAVCLAIFVFRGWLPGGVVASYGAAHALLALVFTAAVARPKWATLASAVGLVAAGGEAIFWSWLFSRRVPTELLFVPVFTCLVRILPFGLRLVDGKRPGVVLRGAAPWIAAIVHTAAAFAMLLVIGPAFEPGASAGYHEFRQRLWSLSWGFWMVGALTLIAFYGWWSCFLPSRRAGTAAFALACLGAAFDLMCESFLAAGRPDIESAREFGRITTLFANGFYCIAGVILTLATPRMPRWLLVWTWALWIAGFGMSAAGAADWLFGIKLTTAVLTVLLCPWFLAMGRFLNSRSAA